MTNNLTQNSNKKETVLVNELFTVHFDTRTFNDDKNSTFL